MPFFLFSFFVERKNCQHFEHSIHCVLACIISVNNLPSLLLPLKGYYNIFLWLRLTFFVCLWYSPILLWYVLCSSLCIYSTLESWHFSNLLLNVFLSFEQFFDINLLNISSLPFFSFRLSLCLSLVLSPSLPLWSSFPPSSFFPHSPSLSLFLLWFQYTYVRLFIGISYASNALSWSFQSIVSLCFSQDLFSDPYFTWMIFSPTQSNLHWSLNLEYLFVSWFSIWVWGSCMSAIFCNSSFYHIISETYISFTASIPVFPIDLLLFFSLDFWPVYAIFACYLFYSGSYPFCVW